jgi:hypothetical protein
MNARKVFEFVLTIFIGREAVGWVKQHTGQLRWVLAYSSWAVLLLFVGLLVFSYYAGVWVDPWSRPQPMCWGCLLKNH